MFNFTLRYNDPVENTNAALYNGNISQTSWNTKNVDNTVKTYTYAYDPLNRITGATGGTNSNYDVSGIQYDKNGNIKNLIRRGHLDNTTTPAFGIMDDLVYSYQPNSNKLTKVADGALNDQYGFKDDAVNTTVDSKDDYSYDANGNMISDANKGITAITYNHLNLPRQVTLSSGNIEYVYDATGVKLEKVVKTQFSKNNKTQYAGNYIYEVSWLEPGRPESPQPDKTPKLQFFNHPEGYVNVENGSYEYVYQYKDHLGNIRLSYSDADNNGAVDSSEIIEEKNYYPLGLTHKGYNNVINGTAHPYGFNGKEENQELGLDWLDFSARNYDPALGRWMNIDPLAEQMRRHSPYNYAFNNPLRFVDPDGMAPDDVIIKGEKADEAFKQLKASTSLRLKMDDNGKVTAKGKAKTDADKTLLEAINSETVEVSINATDSNFTDSGNWFVGGAFGGSEVNEDGKTVANQTVNPEQTETIDEFYGVQNGVSVLHEVLEAYVGGKDSPGTGAPTFDDVKNKTSNGTNYLNAHNKVEALDPRHVAPTISQDPTTGQLYINKPHPVIPQLNTEKLINNLSKKKN